MERIVSQIPEVKRLCESYALDFKDCGNGHVQVSGHGNLVNYWPDSKSRTAHSPTLNRKETQCTPWDVIQLCKSEAKKGMRPKIANEIKSKGRAQFSLKPITTTGYPKHLYRGELEPWDESHGEFKHLKPSDDLRLEAWQLNQQSAQVKAKADLMDE